LTSDVKSSDLVTDNLSQHLKAELFDSNPQLVTSGKTLTGLVCVKCKNLIERLHSLHQELEAIRQQLLECWESRLSVQVKIIKIDGERRWADCIEANVRASAQVLCRDSEHLFTGKSTVPALDLVKSCPFFHRHLEGVGPVFLSSEVSHDATSVKPSSIGGSKCLSCYSLFTSYVAAVGHCRKDCKPSKGKTMAFACRVCSKRFTRKAYLLEHMSRHDGTKDKECRICNKKFYNSSYWRHMALVHPKADKLKHQCKICHRSFPQAFVLKQHMRSHIKYNEREHVCQMCPDKRKFASSHQLKTHLNKVHIDGAHFQLCPECGNTYSTKRKAQGGDRKACPVCCQRLVENRMAASSLEFLEIPGMSMSHSKSAVMIPDLDCDICGRRFPTEEEFLFHQSKDHGLFELTDDIIIQTDDVIVEDADVFEDIMPTVVTVNTDLLSIVQLNTGDEIPLVNNGADQILTDDLICAETFEDVTTEPAHNLNLQPQSKRTCQVCLNKFDSQVKLDEHAKSHGKKSALTCEYCQKTFKLTKELKRHIRVHTGEKPYKCTYCDKTFSASSNLSEHLTIHTGKMAYECEFCHRKFRLSSTLKKHLNKKMSCVPVTSS